MKWTVKIMWPIYFSLFVGKCDASYFLWVVTSTFMSSLYFQWFIVHSTRYVQLHIVMSQKTNKKIWIKLNLIWKNEKNEQRQHMLSSQSHNDNILRKNSSYTLISILRCMLWRSWASSSSQADNCISKNIVLNQNEENYN